MEKNQTTPGAERRAAPRLPIQIKFKYRTIGQRGEAEVLNSAASKNISSAGLLFENEKQIPIDTEMQLVLILPGAALMTIDAQAKVTRVEKISPGSFDIGVAFTAISEKDRDVLKDLIERMDIIKLLSKVNKKEISDVHLTANSPPMIRYYGEIKPLNNQPLTAEEVRQMVYSILNEEQRKGLVADKDLDFIFAPNPDLRYRVSIYQQRGTPEVVFRVILPTIKSREELGLPQVIEELCQFKDGIIFITGPTGSGKTTTITTMIDIINRTRGGVILSLEKPIEYLHTNIKGVVKQREVGKDVATFASGLKAALRQDSDVIVVGEILDADTIETALQAAETGHLVITTLHATDTTQVFDRIVTFFPMQQREFVYARLSHCLRAVINQKLMPHSSGIGRVLATEICIANTAVKRIIYTGEFSQLPSIIQTGSKFKMQLMRDSITSLFEQGFISAETYDMYTRENP